MSRLLPTSFRFFWRDFKDRKFKLLDVGAGNHSAQLTKQWFPKCEYYGIDQVRDYNNDKDDFEWMKEFYQLDLTQLDFDIIPNSFFDVMILSHVLEHLKNGDKVLAGLLPKLRQGALVYIEFPSARSQRLPSKKGTLNFYDDPTHCRVFSAEEVSHMLRQQGCVIEKAGVRHNWIRIVLLPLLMLSSKMKKGYVEGSVFWDILGFAEYVFARKT